MRFVDSERRFSGLTPSDLCGDARALAASNAQTTPPGTLNWLATFGRYATGSQNGGTAFLKLLARYQSPADRSLILANNRLVKQSNSALRSLVTTESRKLFSALGLSG